MKKKKLLAGVLVGAMLIAMAAPAMAENVSTDTVYVDGVTLSAAADTIAIGGTTQLTTGYTGGKTVDGTSVWNSGGGDQYALTGDFDVAVKFYNDAFTGGTDNWDNFVFEFFTTDGQEGLTLRADAYGWTYNANPTSSYTVTNSWNGDWTDWATICDEQIVIIEVKKTDDNTITVDITFTESEATEQYVITYPNGIPTDGLYFQVGASGGCITVYDYTADYSNGFTTDPVYTSSNTNIATVDANGSVTGVAAGSATITATCGSYTATYDITVTADSIPITSVTATAAITDLIEGGTASVITSYEPASTTDDTTVTYESSDTSVVTVAEDGTVTAVGAGTATVTATIAGVESDSVTFTVTGKTNNVLDCSGWWTDFSQGFELTEEETVFTLNTINNSTNNWNNVVFVVYTADDPSTFDSSATSYSEYWVGRVDSYGWAGGAGSGYYTATSTPNWTDFVAATQAGAEVTITASVSGNTATVNLVCAGVDYTTTITVDGDKPVYLSLTGEVCTLSNLKVNDVPTDFNAGTLFAGYYTDEALTTASSDETNYLKFVDEEVLTVLFQLNAGASADSDSVNLRMLSSVDSLKYSSVGFTVSYGEKSVTTSSSSVYKSVTADGGNYTASDAFCDSSEYIFTLRLNNIPSSAFDTEITVTPQWTTLDGTVVTGTTRTTTVSELFD